jgi:hypothetical protein
MAVSLFQLISSFLALCFAAIVVSAETHTVRFNNQCGHGTPQLIQGADLLSTGADYVSNGPLSSAIAYLQTGNCGFNGENCVLVEMTLGNPTCPGCGSSSDLSLIPPHAFNVETGFSYFGGCDGQGTTCDNGSCRTAFFNPNDNQVQVACQTDNVGLLITFCGSGPAAPAPASGSSSQPTTTKAITPVAPITYASITDAPAATPTTSTVAATASAPAAVALNPSPKEASIVPSATPSAASRCRRRPSPTAARRDVEDSTANEARALYSDHQRRHQQARAVRFGRRSTF